MSGIVTFSEALRIIQTHAGRLTTGEHESVDLLHVLRRVLAENVAADRDQPPFDRATRDGFALDAAEWSRGQKLRVIGQIRAGDTWSGRVVASGSAVDILTGARVPTSVNAGAMR